MGPEDIFKNANKGQNRIIIPGEENNPQSPDPIQVLAMEMQRLGQGLAHTSRTNALIGRATDISQLSVQLLFNILVEKEIISEEDMKKRYQEEVIERYKQMEIDARKYAENQMKEQQEKELKDLKEASNQSDKETEAVISDAKEAIDNIKHVVRTNE